MEAHHITTSSKTLFNKVRKIVPPLLERFHKGKQAPPTHRQGRQTDHSPGQQGRVAVIGGCAEYVQLLYYDTVCGTETRKATQALPTFPQWPPPN